MDTTPVWQRDLSPVSYPPLDRDRQVDVLIIGAGITGLTAAYLLQKAGVKTAVVDRATIGSGETAHTTAHLTYLTDTRLKDLVDTFGREHARAAWQAGEMAMQTIAQIALSEEIDCNLQWLPGYLVASAEEAAEDGGKKLAEEAQLAAELEFDVAYTDHDPLWKRPALVAANQAQFHPLRYLQGVARAVVRHGGEIFEHTNAEEFLDGCRHVRANEHQIFFRHVIVATHVPMQGFSGTASAALLQTKLAAYSSYAVGANVPAGTLPRALFWDTANPYTYVRVQNFGAHDYVILGGADHKTGQVEQTAHCFVSLEAALRHLAPAADIDARWSGQVIEPVDGLPYIGETEERQYVATGFSGNGMTFGTISGVILSDAICGVRNPWQPLFDPHRKKLSASWDYMKENKDYPYYLVKDRLRAADGGRSDQLPPGEGRIIRHHGAKTAAYCDEHGKVTLLSPVCPHMGCIVAWNNSERTWDCPCHGSRFTATGDVMSGPAEKPLPPAKID